MNMKSTITPQQLFSEVATPNIQRSTFPRNHFRSGTFPADKLIPLTWDRIYPGDTMNMSVSGAIRYNTLLKPLQANQFVDFHAFFVPLRLVQENFKKMMGEQEDPDSSIDFVTPKIVIPAGGFDFGTNYDYLGIPPERGVGEEITADVFRAITATWNRWFRDQNLQDSIYSPTDDGPDIAANYDDLLPRGKRKDFVTSALPWPQKGDAVSIAIGTTAPVTGIGKNNQTYPTTNQLVYETGGSGTTNYSKAAVIESSDDNLKFFVEEEPTTGFPNIYADLSDASSITINALRQYNMLQVYLENDARGGTRYNESTYSHFGVMSEDSRVQDPELIGYYSTLVDVTAVPQQSASLAGTPQANLAAMGTINFQGAHLYNKSFTEHGITFVLMSIRTDQVYQQGLHRNWSLSTRFDFYSPEFAHLGEEAIKNKEIYLQDITEVDAGGNPVNDNAFGYQERFYYMRYMESYVTDQYRSEHSASLDSWHLAQEFGSLPLLDSDFIIEDNPIARVVAVPSAPDFNGEILFDYDCTRPMPVRSIPSLMDRM